MGIEELLQQQKETYNSRVEELEVKRSELLEFDREGLTAEDLTRMETVQTEFHTAETAMNEAKAEVEKTEKRSELLNRARKSSYSQEKLGVNVGGPQRSKSTNDVLNDIQSNQISRGDLRERALDLLDGQEDYVTASSKQKIENIVRRNDKRGRIARHAVTYGSEEYMEAFEEAIQMGGDLSRMDQDKANLIRRTEQIKRQMQIDDASAHSGHLMLPTLLDPTLMLTNDGTVNPLRQLADVRTISQNTWNGVSTAGVDADWYEESAQTNDHNPTVAPRSVTTHAARAWVFSSYEFDQDSNFAGQLGMLFNDARDRLESTAFQVGSGTGQPEGIVTGLDGTNAVVFDGGDYAVADVYDLTAQVPPRHSPQLAYLANKGTLMATRQFGVDDVSHAFWADLGPATPSQLLGRPIHEASELPNHDNGADEGYLIAGNFSRYLIADRIGATVAQEPLVMRPRGDNADQLAPSGERGWFLFWRTGAAVQDSNAFRMLVNGTEPA